MATTLLFPPEPFWVNNGGGGGLVPHNIGDHADVQLSTPVLDQQLLVFDAGTSVWINAEVPEHPLERHSNVTITLAQDGQVLTYNAGTGQWENKDPVLVSHNIEDHANYNNTVTAADGQALFYNGTTSQWEPRDIPLVPHTLNDHTDVDTTGAVANMTLVFDGTQWVANNVPLAPHSLNDHIDVVISTPSTDEVIVFDGTNWVNGPVPLAPHALGNHIDVVLNAPVDGQILKYDGLTKTWVNADVPLAPHTLNDHTDVDTTGAADGNALIYNGTTNTWVAGIVSTVQVLNDLSDVNTTPADGDVLTYNAGTGTWIAQAPQAVPQALNDLTDVSAATPNDGDVLVYDGTAGQWVNTAPAWSTVQNLGDLNDVTILAPQDNNEVIVFDLAQGQWLNKKLVLSLLDDVTVNTPTDGQVLTYNSLAGGWINDTPPLTAHSLSDHTDVLLTTPAAGDILAFDGTNWVNQVPQVPAHALTDHTDVSILAPAAGQTLYFDGTNWINQDPVLVTHNLEDHANVTITTTPNDGDVLTYDAALGAWVASASTGGAQVLDDLNDVTILAPVDDQQILIYDLNTGQWFNQPHILNNLKDVNAPAATQDQILTYDETNAEWVVSDLALSKLVIDTDKDWQAFSITNLTRVTANSFNYNSGTAVVDAAGALTLDFSQGDFLYVLVDKDITSITITNPPSSGRMYVLFQQDSVGGHAITATWPSNVLWEYGDIPSLNTTANAYTLVSLLYFAGAAVYLGAYSTNFTPN